MKEGASFMVKLLQSILSSWEGGGGLVIEKKEFGVFQNRSRSLQKKGYRAKSWGEKKGRKQCHLGKEREGRKGTIKYHFRSFPEGTTEGRMGSEKELDLLREGIEGCRTGERGERTF